MDKELLKFMNGEVNVARIDCLIRKEIMPNGVTHLWVTNTDGEEILLCEEYRKADDRRNKGSPKHSGGKKPYVMLMTEEIETLKSQGIKNTDELVGFLASLSKYIEWNTGNLIQKRSKKPLQYKDLKEIFPYGNKKLNRILNDLREHDLLFNTTEGYFISGRIIKRGRMKGAVRNGL